jgi:hypothetical protein
MLTRRGDDTGTTGYRSDVRSRASTASGHARIVTVALTLPLFVPRVGRTNHVDLAFAAHDLTIFTNAFNAGSDFHDSDRISCNSTLFRCRRNK